MVISAQLMSLLSCIRDSNVADCASALYASVSSGSDEGAPPFIDGNTCDLVTYLPVIPLLLLINRQIVSLVPKARLQTIPMTLTTWRLHIIIHLDADGGIRVTT